jgi:Leucine-rich repeat (LRR) protein
VQEVLIQSPHVIDLSLCNNRINDMHLGMLVESMRDGSCHLKQLDVSHNALTKVSVQALLPHCCNTAATVQGSPCNSLHEIRPPQSGLCRPRSGHVTLLTHLNLSGNAIADAGAKLLCQEMCKGGLICELVVLLLEDCKLTERCASAIEDMLLSTRCLKQLSIAWNCFGTRGAQALARGIQSNISLSSLLMPWTGVGDVGASHIVEALKANSVLREIDLSGTRASASTSVVAASLLSKNSTLQSLRLHHNSLTQHGVRVLLLAVLLQADRDLVIELQGASLVKQDASSLPVVLDAANPDGTYSIDLSHPGQRQVVIDLARSALLLLA